MPLAEWTKEALPGGAWGYNTPTLAYNAPMFDGLAVKYNSLGEVTEWANETT